MSEHFRYTKVERLEARLLLAVTTGADGLAAVGHTVHTSASASTSTDTTAATIANCLPGCAPIDGRQASTDSSGTAANDNSHASPGTPTPSPAVSSSERSGIAAAVHGATHGQIMAALDQAHLYPPAFGLNDDRMDSNHADTTDADHAIAWLLTSAEHHGSVVPDDDMAGTSSGHTMMDESASAPADSSGGSAAGALDSNAGHGEDGLAGFEAPSMEASTMALSGVELPGLEIDITAMPFGTPHLAGPDDAQEAPFADEMIPIADEAPILADASYDVPVLSTLLVAENSPTATSPSAPLTASAIDVTMVAMRPDLADPSTEALADELTSPASETDPQARWLGIAIATGASLVAGALEFRLARQSRTKTSNGPSTEFYSSQRPVLRVVPRSRIG